MNNDLISRSALLEDLQEYLNQEATANMTFTDMGEGIDLSMERVKEAHTVDAEPVRYWISVNDRLPDDLEEVLILVKETEFYGQYKEFSKSYFCQYIGCVDDGEWFTVWCHGHRYIKDTAKEPYSDKLEVTHWMPLPEPPKEE